MKLIPKYIGIRLGREYSLSAAEIFSLIEANELGLQFYDVTENILILNSTNQRKDYLEYLSQSGGVIKIFELPFIYRGVGQKGYKEDRDKLYSWLKNINLINDYLKDVLYEKQKFVFGVSSYALSDFKGNINDLRKSNEFFGMFLKNELKRYKLKSGFMGVVSKRNPPELTSVEITRKKLLERSFELVSCIGKDEIFVGKTLWVQDYQSFEKRDIFRPVKMPKIMTPTKLSLMLLNLSLKSGSKRFLDPFCGTGTILQEASLRCLDVYGADIDPWCIKATKENLRWLIKEFNLNIDTNGTLSKIFQCDVRKLSTQIKDNYIDAIATEPYLGPPIKGVPSLRDIYKTINDLQQFYFQSLKELRKILKDKARVVITFPIYRIKHQQIFIDIEEISNIGFKIINPLAFAPISKFLKLTRRNTLTYYREYQKVGREVVVLEKSQKRRNCNG